MNEKRRTSPSANALLFPAGRTRPMTGFSVCIPSSAVWYINRTCLAKKRCVSPSAIGTHSHGAYQCSAGWLQAGKVSRADGKGVKIARVGIQVVRDLMLEIGISSNRARRQDQYAG